MKLPKLPTENIGQIILAVWIIFSVVFVANDVWQRFKQTQMTAAYQQAQADTVRQLIQQADTCEVFPVFLGDKQIELKKVGCE